MKRKNGLFLGFLLACLVTMFLLPAGVMADSEETINLKFSTWHAPAGREVKTVWKPMLAELEKRSNGRIKTTLYAGSAWEKARSILISCARECPTWDILPPPGPRSVSAN